MTMRKLSRREFLTRNALHSATLFGVTALVSTYEISEGRAASSSGTTTVQYLVAQGSMGDWTPFVAEDLGYFKDEKIDFQPHTFARPSDILTAIISGRGDIAASSLASVIAGAFAGAPIELISSAQRATPGGGYDNWWAALPNSPLDRPADLRNKKIDIYSQNSLAQAVTREILASAGINVGEFQEVGLPWPQVYTSLDSGLVDVGLFIEPFFTQANALSRKKYGKPLKVIYTYLTEFPNGLDLSGIFINTNFAKKNPDTVRAFLRATTRAAKWGNAHPTDLKQIIAKHAGVPYEQIKDMIPSEMSESGTFFPGMIDRLQALMIKHKMIPNFTTPLPLTRLVDLSYLPSGK